MSFLGLSWEFYLVAWVVVCVGVVPFFAGAFAQRRGGEVSDHLWDDAPMIEGPLAEVIPFPRCDGFDVDVPEYRPITDGVREGWIA